MLGAVYRSLLHRSTDHSLHGIRADLLSAVLLPLPGSNKVRGNSTILGGVSLPV